MYSTYQPTPQINPYQYYNPYPMGYNPNPVVSAPVATPTVQPNTQTTSVPQVKLDTVSGRTAADVYNVEVGQKVILFDIDNPCVYEKYRDMDNKLTTEIYDLTLHTEVAPVTAQSINLDEYVKAETIEQIISDRVKAEVDKRLSEISFTPATRTRKTKVVEVDE